MNDRSCDYPNCDTDAVGDYSIGLFHVQFCEEHRDHFEHQRNEYFAGQRRKGRGR